jgi:hypothetical protein
VRIKLIVPQSGGGRLIDPIVAYGLSVARIAGGFTSHKATGGWIDGSGVLVVEPVTVFECGMDTAQASDYAKAEAAFVTLARQIGRNLKQDCVYLEIDGHTVFVKP